MLKLGKYRVTSEGSMTPELCPREDTSLVAECGKEEKRHYVHMTSGSRARSG